MDHPRSGGIAVFQQHRVLRIEDEIKDGGVRWENMHHLHVCYGWTFHCFPIICTPRGLSNMSFVFRRRANICRGHVSSTASLRGLIDCITVIK